MTKLQRCLATLVFSFIVTALNWPSVAFACETLETAKLDSECVVMTRDGQRGVWFRLSAADKIRKMKLELPELRLQIEKYELAEEERQSEVRELKMAIELQKSSLMALESTIENHAKEAREAEERAKAAEDELDKWYRSPWLWGAVGIAVGVGSTLLIADQFSE